MPHRFTSEHLKDVVHGLEDVKVVATVKSLVDGSGEGALYYLGYSISDLVGRSNYEEVVFLLLYDRLPSIEEFAAFRKRLSGYFVIDKRIIKLMKHLGFCDHPTASLRTVVSALSSIDSLAEDCSDAANEEKALRLIAQLPMIVACSLRLRNGQRIVDADPSLSIAENFVLMTSGKRDDLKARVLDSCLILHADHELNASTFAARQCVSTNSDIYSAVTSAIASLKGPLHGGASEGVIRMLLEIGDGDPEKFVLDKLVRKERVMGFGHRVYRGGDPRARILKGMAKELCEKTGNSGLFGRALKVEEVVGREKGLKANVDFFSAVVYYCLGIPSGLFTSLFAMARISGWTAHVLEQYHNNRLMRPKSVYVEELAPLDREYVEIGKR